MSTKNTLKGRNTPAHIKTGKARVQTLEGMGVTTDSARLDQMIDETIYIVKLERKASDNYGDGFVVSFVDIPGSREIRSAGVFGQYPVAQLEKAFTLSHDGKTINQDNPLKVTIRQAGKSYRLE